MHSVASWANSAIFGVAIVWKAVDHGRAAVFAVFDRRSVNHPLSLRGNLSVMFMTEQSHKKRL
jgi:hypothetical protein